MQEPLRTIKRMVRLSRAVSREAAYIPTPKPHSLRLSHAMPPDTTLLAAQSASKRRRFLLLHFEWRAFEVCEQCGCFQEDSGSKIPLPRRV